MSAVLIVGRRPGMLAALRRDGETITDVALALPWDPPAVGSRHRARVLRVDRGLGAAFLTLTGDPSALPAMLPLRRGETLAEGDSLFVTIDRPARAEAHKGPRVARLAGAEAGAAAAHPGNGPPGPLPDRPPLADLLALLPIDAAPVETADRALAALVASTGRAVRLTDGQEDVLALADFDAVLADSLAPEVALPGGGRLIVEPTAALVTIDVDTGGRLSRNRGESTGVEAVRQFTEVALTRAAVEIRRRGLAGTILIDLPTVRARERRDAVTAQMIAATAGDPWGITVAPLNALGHLVLTRTRRAPSLWDRFSQPAGDGSLPGGRAWHPAWIGLQALWAVERAVAVSPGGWPRLRAGAAVIASLDGVLAPVRREVEARLGRPIACDPVAPGPRGDAVDILAEVSR